MIVRILLALGRTRGLAQSPSLCTHQIVERRTRAARERLRRRELRRRTGGYPVRRRRPLVYAFMPTHIERIAFTAALASACAVAVYLRRRRRKKLPPPGPPQPALLANAAELRRLLEVIEMEILPKTAVRVAAGDKVFGAAILKEDLGTVVAETNHETENPMYHGEVYAIREWSSVCRSCDPSVGPPAAADSIFLATHEPCCMCISSIVWSGFKRCYYLFPYETTRDQGIPHCLLYTSPSPRDGLLSRMPSSA